VHVCSAIDLQSIQKHLALYQSHSRGLAATYADLENHARAQGAVLFGTPGSVRLLENAGGVRFYARQYYDHDKVKRSQYVAAADAEDADRRVELARTRIKETNDVIASIRLLAREGYSTVTPKQFATIASLANHGVFEAGAVLVGTHAFGAIVNRMGIRTAVFQTEDVDVARPARLAFRPGSQADLLTMLRDSGIDFVEVPPLDRKAPSTKFKERGRSRFTFDLLVPTAGNEAGIEAVPELKVHATALPCLRYLVAESQPGAVLSNHGAAAVRLPVPERFALHKLLVSRLRVGRSAKSRKDLDQAALLIAALGETQSGALEAAWAATPVSARGNIRKSLLEIKGMLAAHPQSWEAAAAACGI